MFKGKKQHVLLLLVFAFSFIYRLLLMLWQTFPPGADIGLHNSIIHSITQSGNTNFLWNFYQMGEGLSLTFPGYHIFASQIIIMTGMPDYFVQAVIAALFSALIVLCAFLITRTVWTESAAFIVAFLVAISRFDMEILLWGGYPNAVTLLLIPLTFFLYLQRDRFSTTPFLCSASILAGSIFLTHSLSAAIFVGITFVTTIFVIIFPKALNTSRNNILYWLLPILLGAILVSPFLVNAIPAYLSSNSTFKSVQDIQSALLSTRILPLELVFPLFGILVAFFMFSKKYNGRFLNLPVLLLSLWLAVPLVLTQGYLFEFYIDYNRFLYFIILPTMIFIALLIDHGSDFFAKIIDTYRTWTSQMRKSGKTSNDVLNRFSARLTYKTIYSVFILFFLLFSFVVLPIFMTPSLKMGETIQSFYQVMDDPGYEAIQWAKQNTLPGSVFVSDALYGWWLSGFAQRPTLSAVDPQYLTLSREFEPAQLAKNLLDTDYLVDNGLIQIREDGGYLARHNPEILAKLNWTYFPYSFFNFNSSQTRIYYRINGNSQFTYLDQLTVKEMRMENNIDRVTTTVVRGNDFFNYTQITTVYQGLSFVNMTTTIDSAIPGISLDWIYITIQGKGKEIPYFENSTVGLLDEGVKVFGQLIFRQNQPQIDRTWPENPLILGLQYSLQGKSQGEIQILASAYSVTDNPQFYNDDATKNSYFNEIMTSNLKTTQNAVDLPFERIFNYRQGIQNFSVSYIACRDPEIEPKFSRDPLFSLVFINNEVAIFKVKATIN
jgi:hypothetical protein